MRIAVELNNIIRDHNSQVLKYYRKEIDPAIDDETLDMDCTDLLEVLPFRNNAEKKEFKEIKYPYELFGCAKTTSKHIHVALTDWLDNNEDIEVIYFSTKESSLMIQSTYFFLSKGSRVKTMIFLDDPKKIWEFCDVVVTLNKEIVDSKPEGKKVVVIKRSDNKNLQKKADFVFDKFIDIIQNKKETNRLLDYKGNGKSYTSKFINSLKNILLWKKK